VTVPIYVFYWKGPQIRARSKFAQELETGRKGKNDKRGNKNREKAERNSSKGEKEVEHNEEV